MNLFVNCLEPARKRTLRQLIVAGALGLLSLFAGSANAQTALMLQAAEATAPVAAEWR